MYNPNCCMAGGPTYPSGHQAPSFAVPYTYTPAVMPAQIPVESLLPQQPSQPAAQVQVGTVPMQVPYAPPAQGTYCGFGMGGGFGYGMGAGYGNNNYSPYYSTYPSGYSMGGYGGYGYGVGGYNYGGMY